LERDKDHVYTNLGSKALWSETCCVAVFAVAAGVAAAGVGWLAAQTLRRPRR